MEEWKDIPQYEEYQVSNIGRIRTFNKITYTEKHGARHWKNRILKPKIQCKKDGRKDYRVNLWKNGKPHTILISRLVAFTFLNEDINNRELTVNHINGNSIDNSLSNLEIVSLKENIQHALRNHLIDTCKRIKIEDKITGTIIYASSLAEGSRLMGFNLGYLSSKIKQNKWQNNRYKWQLF